MPIKNGCVYSLTSFQCVLYPVKYSLSEFGSSYRLKYLRTGGVDNRNGTVTLVIVTGGASGIPCHDREKFKDRTSGSCRKSRTSSTHPSSYLCRRLTSLVTVAFRFPQTKYTGRQYGRHMDPHFPSPSHDVGPDPLGGLYEKKRLRPGPTTLVGPPSS